jgi:uncharacterized protein YegL
MSATEEQVQVPGGDYNYTTVPVDELEDYEYTKVQIVSDVSGSVGPYKTEMEEAIKEAIGACMTSPRADNLLVRHTQFGSDIKESHGWKLLPQINTGDYDDCLEINGLTALYDATDEAVTVMRDSGKRLTEANYKVNGIVFIITDGWDNQSHATANTVKKTIQETNKSEALESLVTILIGVGTGSADNQKLQEFKDNAGLTHFLKIDDASKSSLAKLAQFISKSISDQSQALGTGGPSKALTSEDLTI